MQPSGQSTSDSENLPASGLEPCAARFAFVHACWHHEIVEQARDAFAAEMRRLGVAPEAIDVFPVPGAFELPLHAKKLARSGRYDAVVACALVVDGGIYRHDFVADAVVGALMAVQLEAEVPVLSVVLTPHQFHGHAEHRDFFASHFVLKGAEAARACLQTVDSLRRLAQPASMAALALHGDRDSQIQ